MASEGSIEQACAAAGAAPGILRACEAREELFGGNGFRFFDGRLAELGACLIEGGVLALAVESIAAHRL